MTETPTEMSTGGVDGLSNGDANATTSLSKKVLENIDKILKHIEVSREDLFSVTKSLLEAFKALNNRLQASETENNLLTKSLIDSMAACNALQEDVLRLREAHANEAARSDKLTADMEQMKEEFRQLMSEKKVSNADSLNLFPALVENAQKKVDDLEVNEKDDETNGHTGDENACAGKDKSDEVVHESQENDIVNKPTRDLQMEKVDSSESTIRSATTISTVEEIEEKLTTEYVTSEDSENEEEGEEEGENSFKECVGAKPVITSSLTTVSTTADAAATAAASQKPEIISHSITQDDSALNSYNDQPEEVPAKQHYFEETSRLWFNTCQLCKSSIIPTTKFFVCTGCKIKVDKTCFESNQVTAMDVPCISVNLVSLVQMEKKMTNVGHLQPQVPTIIVECCKQIEEQAIAILKTGTHSPSFGSKFTLKSSPQLRLYKELDAKSSKEVEKLFTAFARSHNVAELKLNSIHPTIVSGLLVRLLQSLGQPLVDSKWWNDCLRASNPSLTSVQRRDLFTRLLTTKLEPVVHRHTLAYLLLHLKRVLFKLPTISKSGRVVVDKHQLLNLFGPLIAPSFNRTATTPLSGMLGSAAARGGSAEKGGKQALIKMTHLKRQIVIALFNLPQECLQEVLKSGAESKTSGTGKQLSPRTNNFGNILMNERQRQNFNKQMNNIY